MKVLLVSMPFTAIERPALGLSVLKARLQEAAIPCDVSYLSLAFASLLGRDAYDRIVHDVQYTALVCEWVFRSALFGRSPDDQEYVEDLHRRWRLADDVVDHILRARAEASGFIARAAQETPWEDYGVVGFTTVGQQNLASLALAKAAKERSPGSAMVFGGHAWEGQMGRELLRHFDFVDFALSGEADESLPMLVANLARSGSPLVPGLIYRGQSRVTMVPEGRVGSALPNAIPDHQDYFLARSESPQVERGPLVIPVEASRGCWWASRHACAFCGLSGHKRVYRTKAPDAVLREIRTAARLWPGARIDMVDNVVPDAFLDEVLPQLADDRLPVGFAFAVRPGVRREHVRNAAAVGTALQCGVESLSDGVLSRMRKGARGLENIRFLRWCKEFEVDLDWNLLYAVPGETAAEYRHVMEALPWIRFLQPPVSCAPVQIERFSAYFSRPDDFGFRNVRPARAYRSIYPFSPGALKRIAYFFDFNRPSESGRPGWVQHLRIEVKAWQRTPDQGVLAWTDTGEELMLSDGRGGGGRRATKLKGVDREILRACEDVVGFTRLCSLVGADSEEPSQVDALRDRLRKFMDRGWLVTDGDRYLSLAIPGPAR